MWIYIIIAVPLLFVVGTVYTALKEQKRLEKGELKRVLEKRALEKHSLLTKYEGKFTKKMFAAFAGILLGLGVLASGACYIASIIFVRFFYPGVFAEAKQYFFLANAGQVFYFISNCLMTVILRVSDEKYQMYIKI